MYIHTHTHTHANTHTHTHTHTNTHIHIHMYWELAAEQRRKNLQKRTGRKEKLNLKKKNFVLGSSSAVSLLKNVIRKKELGGMPGGAVHMQRRARRPGINTEMC